MAKPWVGVSGWTFPGWRRNFYPKDLPQRRELEYASRALNSIEINGTFYSLQKPESFQSWFKETPADFRFAVKAPQYITHIRRLKEVEEPLANFFASGLLCLKEKLGALLWQFPPNVTLKDDRFEKFLKLLPRDSRDAAKLARKHGEKVEGRAWTKAEGDYPIRHAFEFRHPSFANPDFLAMLKEYNVAFVMAHEGGERAPYLEDLTADFVYVRLHGEGAKYKKGYPEKEIRGWADRVKAWLEGSQPSDAQILSDIKPKKAKRDVFLYFSNDAKVHAPAGAQSLLRHLKVSRESDFSRNEKAA